MKLRVSAELRYDFLPGTEAIVAVQAAKSADQTVLSETLTIDPPVKMVLDPPDAYGERRVRARVGGEVRLRYEAIVDNGRRIPPGPGAFQSTWSQLPADVVQYLLPSRYCPSDKFISFAQREFGEAGQGGAAVLAVLDWLAAHIDYVGGISHSGTTAEHTFVERKGVCRDFTHLGITLCRALNIPSRAVSAYALDLDPPDFHAVFEVFLNGSWWLVDPTRLVPVENLVRILNGRDAADIAFLTTSMGCELIEQSVTVVRTD